MSNPVRWARLKRLGGFQYSGKKISSVSPNSVIARLAAT